jgi:hypothetical protein
MTSFLQKKFSDITISKKLYFTVGVMALLVTIELCTLWFSVSTLSSVRAFVNGEGLWSKAQKDAVYNLVIYAHSHNEKDYQAFRDFLKVPLGDNKTRVELHKPDPDLEIARQGFIEGRNNPDDVNGMINLIIRFHNYSYLNKALTAWEGAEKKMEQLVAIGDKMHQAIQTNTVSQAEIDQMLSQIEMLNTQFTTYEDEFSFALVEGSRKVETIILRLLLTLSLTIGTTSILITISVSRGIEKGVKAIVEGADMVSHGLLNTRVKVYSRDEIGAIAISFNEMAARLEQSLYRIQELNVSKNNLSREKEKAEASEKAKKLFLAKMSHEIRTPMNAILGFARLLEESLTTKEQLEYIQIIIKSGDDLLVILNDILDFSRIDAGKIVFDNQPFCPAEVVKTTILMMEPKATQKGLYLKYTFDNQLPEKVLGDAVRLSQILLNLVSNAIKFTENGGVSISVVILEETMDSVLLDFGVKDTGIGIYPNQKERIFESFEQATNETIRQFGGTGLGLSIVKQLVELQNGHVFVNSKPNHGSDFHFRLSFRKVQESANKVTTETTASVLPKARGISVLIAEDNQINQALILKVLRKQGFETDLAENGLAALRKFEAGNYDIILMDLQMPEMDGYEAARNIRVSNHPNRDIPIIALSAHIFKAESDRCLEMGINDFISKPFNTRELFEKMHHHLNKNAREKSFTPQTNNV